MTDAAEFLGFQQPKRDLNARSWKERIQALHDEHLNKWAKYGPFSSKKATQNTAARIKRQGKEMQLKVETHIEGNEFREQFLFVRVRE